jgi:pimeloyl-ACP methyl ester carboxylesterase
VTPALRWTAFAFALVLVVAGGVVAYDHRGSKGHASALTPADPTLRKPWLYFYPARTSTPRAFMVFFGNDVAFWEPHQDLAWRFSGEGIAVVGIDLRKYFSTLPDGEPVRDSAFAADMPALIARARRSMSGDSLPLILAGHSFGAEVALWIGQHAPPPHLVGILALNTRSTGHLFITPSDWLNHEASGPWSFSTIDAVRAIDPYVRIALVRGAHDPFRGHDSAFAAVGGNRLRRFEIPMAGHALGTLLVAGPLISRAVRFLTDTTGR